MPIFFDQIIQSHSNSNFVSESLFPKPMNSLRDPDDPIIVELDPVGSFWAKNNQ